MDSFTDLRVVQQEQLPLLELEEPPDNHLGQAQEALLHGKFLGFYA